MAKKKNTQGDEVEATEDKTVFLDDSDLMEKAGTGISTEWNEDFTPLSEDRETTEGLKPYWCGCVNTIVFRGDEIQNPRQTVYLAGVDFPRVNEVVPWSVGMDIPRNTPHDGQMKLLSDEQVDNIKAGSISKVVRRDGKVTRLISVNHPTYRRRSTDVPIGAFCYLVPMRSTNQDYPTVGYSKPNMLVT